MLTELWLEFGVRKDDGSIHIPHWNNDGVPERLPYFLTNYFAACREVNKANGMGFYFRWQTDSEFHYLPIGFSEVDEELNDKLKQLLHEYTRCMRRHGSW